jgi:hypothetical protein
MHGGSISPRSRVAEEDPLASTTESQGGGEAGGSASYDYDVIRHVCPPESVGELGCTNLRPVSARHTI